MLLLSFMLLHYLLGLVKAQAEQEGLDKVLIEAGFDWREPGCSMCLVQPPPRVLLFIGRLCSF